MPTESSKSKAVEAKLCDELRGVYRQMVDEYEFFTNAKYGRGYVAYEVLAEMVLAGWRPSGTMHPSSLLAVEGKRGNL